MRDQFGKRSLRGTGSIVMDRMAAEGRGQDWRSGGASSPAHQATIRVGLKDAQQRRKHQQQLSAEQLAAQGRESLDTLDSLDSFVPLSFLQGRESLDSYAAYRGAKPLTGEAHVRDTLVRQAIKHYKAALAAAEPSELASKVYLLMFTADVQSRLEFKRWLR